MKSKVETLYTERDLLDLGSYYSKHIQHLTTEGLDSKSDIAGELAYRDMRIDNLEEVVTVQERMIEQLQLIIDKNC